MRWPRLVREAGSLSPVLLVAVAVGATRLPSDPVTFTRPEADGFGVGGGDRDRGGDEGGEKASMIIKQLEKAADKLRGRAQERVRHGKAEFLGMTPKLWVEALDEKHRYGSVLYYYWQRWETSRTKMTFFRWLDEGRGALVDLPECPRRFLEEGQVMYLSPDDLKLFEVHVLDGRLVWLADNTPVTLPIPPGSSNTRRARAVDALIAERVQLSLRRERLLQEARRSVEDAQRRGEHSTQERLRELLAPLVKEGLLRQLRDPFFSQRPTALDSYEATNDASAVYNQLWDNFRLRAPSASTGILYALPDTLLPDLAWTDVLEALDHEEGRKMRKKFPVVSQRLYSLKPGKGGIFVIDHFGKIYCAQKVSGVFHHTSLTRGHCCRFAGAVQVAEGHLLMLSPHSGHYVPTLAEYNKLVEGWKELGLDFSRTTVRGIIKDV